MLKHEIVWYESNDGKLFVDENECMEHEAKLLYIESGVRFYSHDWKPIEFIVKDDWSYNNADYIVIDRTREKENKLLVDCLYNNFGWCLVKEAFDEDDDTFILKQNCIIPISSHFVY